MVIMANVIDKKDHIPVDLWDTEEYPITEADRIFRNIRGEIILPISEFYFKSNNEDCMQLNYFVMSAKRSYNSDETREHICRYLNYFEKFYDHDKELIMVLAKIKTAIDFGIDGCKYTKTNLIDDINRYIIRNRSLGRKIRMFVDDNYLMRLSNNNNKTPNLQFNNEHAKILYEISLMMNMYIPLATHFMYVNFIRLSADIRKFMLSLFDKCIIKYEEECGIYIYDKIYETAVSVVNKSKNPDKPLWEKNQIRGNNTTTHTKESVNDIILQIMPKYCYDKNIINFNYYSNRQCLRLNITDVAYEYPFVKLSSSKRDQDNNSEFDKYEARLTKKDEALVLQNKAAAEQTVKVIETMYGPFEEDEIEHYRRRLSEGGSPIINSFQQKMVGYLYYKYFGDPVTFNSIHNGTDYIKLMIAAKRILCMSGMKLLPYVISSKVVRTASRRIVSKKEMMRIKNSELYTQISNKYRNPKIEEQILEIIGTIIASSFEIIDWDNEKHAPSEYDRAAMPIISDMLDEEVLMFIANI